MRKTKHGLALAPAIATFLATAVTSWSPASKAQTQGLGQTQIHAASQAAQPFTFESLVELIESRNLKSVEEVLPLLPTALRSNFVLMRDSQSLQQADDLHPRAILFGEDASLTCSFSGNPKLAGFNSLECFQFRPETRRFDFREIAFPTSENQLMKAKVSESNRQALGQAQCTACHGQDPRPNWEAYQTWPGAYGSDDDSFYQTKFNSDRAREADQKRLTEQSQFRTFKNSVAPTSRYASLIFGPSPLAPYSAELKKLDLRLRPNSHFTTSLAQLTATRNARILEAQPRRKQFQYLAAVAGCEGPLRKEVLASISSPVGWTPAFRSFDPDCKGCSETNAQFAQHYVYRDGLIDDLNYYTAEQLLRHLAEAREIPIEVVNEISVFPKGEYLPADEKYYSLLKSIRYADPKAMEGLCPLFKERLQSTSKK